MGTSPPMKFRPTVLSIQKHILKMHTDADRVALLEEEKKQLKASLEESLRQLEKTQKKNKDYKVRLEDVEDRYKKVVWSNLRNVDRYNEMGEQMDKKVSTIKEKLAFHMSKEQKVKTLTDTIKIAIKQSKLEMSSGRMSKGTILRARLTKLVNTFETMFGGVVMLGPLNVAENASLALTKDPSKKFLGIIFSKAARGLAKFMGMTTHNLPVLERSPISTYVLDSRAPYFPDLSLLRLPANHFPMHKALFVPIIVDGKPMGLAGFANGNYDQDDANIIMEILTTAWVSVISEAMKDSQNSMSLFANALPKHIIDRYLAYELEREQFSQRSSERSSISSGNSSDGTQMIIADSYPVASILFIDIVGFTKKSSKLAPEEVVSFLNAFFTTLDTLVEERKLEKIKTIGDCYMVACGIPDRDPKHAEYAAEFALDVMDLVEDFTLGENPIALRIGIHSGPIVAGVIGKSKLTYDVWGDTVNKASRMESTGAPGLIQVTEDTMKFLDGNPKFRLEARGGVEVHGIGKMSTYWLKRQGGNLKKEKLTIEEDDIPKPKGRRLSLSNRPGSLILPLALPKVNASHDDSNGAPDSGKAKFPLIRKSPQFSM